MKMLLTKVCLGVINTDRERLRIKKAFRNEPETRRRLTLLMDAIDAGQWKKARRMLDSKWWHGRDRKRECPRLEFVGRLDLTNPNKLGHLASGFENWVGYAHLVYVMSCRQEAGDSQYTVTPIVESGDNAK